MKTCPRCNTNYPDAESFCESDGTALVPAARAAGSARMNDRMDDPRAVPIECPVCGGKAEPGEVMCNFCGARLPADGSAEPKGAPARGAARGGADVGAARRSPETYVPAQDKVTATDFTPPRGPDEDAEDDRRRPLSSIVGYSVAAIVALAAGAWLA